MTTTPDVEQAAARELAREALATASPDELPILDETADLYFDDPAAALEPGRGEGTVGFGLELALLGPFVVHAAVAAVRWLASVVADSAQEEGAEAVRQGVRALIGRLAGRHPEPGGAPHALALSDADVARLRAVTRSSATSAGLDEARAGLVADAVVGALLRPAAT
jgi:hypothetical protein